MNNEEKNTLKIKNLRKIKKKLLIDIANARIQEISEMILFKNKILLKFLKKNYQYF